MMQTVWMASYVLKSLQDNSSIIYTTRDVIWKHLGVSEDTLILLEPDNGIGHVIHSRHRVVWSGTPGDISLSAEYINNICAAEKMDFTEFGIVAPMKISGSSAFALLILKGVTAVDEDKLPELERAVSAYSAVLYSNAMQSIIRSYHPTAMKVEGLRVSYGPNEIVHGIDFELCENEFAVLLGSSGCGKTSTVNVLGCMLKASGGSVLWRGRDITKFNDIERTAYRRETVGFIFQHYNLISDLTAEENIGVATSLVENPMPIYEALALVGLEDKGKKYPGEMSGGEQQRVCIARALAKRSSLLICDEPTGALDLENSLIVVRILQNIVKQHGIPVIMITHNPAFSVISDHYILMSNGRIEEDLRQPFPLSADKLILL